MTSTDPEKLTGTTDGNLPQASLQFQFVRTLLDVAWICCIPAAAWVLLAFSPEHKPLALAGIVFVAIFDGMLRFLALPKVKTLRQLDLLAMAALTPWWIMTIISLRFAPETGADTESVLMNMVVAAIIIGDRRAFAGWFIFTYGCYIATTFALQIPLTAHQSLFLWILIPAVTVLLRYAVASSFDAVFQEKIERDSANARFSSEQLKLTTVLKQAPLILCVIDAEGKYLKSRGSGLSALELKPDEVIGRHFRDVFTNHPGIAAAIESALNGVSARAHVRFGDSHYEIRYRPTGDSSDVPEAVIGVGIEVTEQVHLAEREKQDERDLLHSQKEQSLATLAGGVAHDFNNYLTSIIGCCEFLLRKPVFVDESDKETVTLIRSTALKAAGLSKQMLIYGGTDPTEDSPPQTLDLSTILNDSKTLLRTMTSGRAEMRFHFEPGKTYPVAANSVLLDQVILNVVKNSIDALPKKGGRIDISIEPFDSNCSVEGRVFGEIKPGITYWQIVCQDNGCGISPEQLNLVLDLYYTTKSTGSGIGLAVTATIMDKLDGAIVISSEVDAGTVVRLILPAVESPDDPPAAEVDASYFDQDKKRFLLVDDNDTVLAATAMMLRTTGAEVLEATSGEQAIQIIEGDRDDFDCILLDYSMPGLDGLETLQQIRAMKRDIPVILCSGYPLEINKANQLPHKPNATLLKPFRLDQILATVDSISASA
jgi:signal transduction histidine kinase/ActR/RegA family two-component response regulator